MWKVYVLLSIKYQKTYIGSTNNLARRLEEHNKGKERFTSIYKPWIPIYIEFYPNEKEARDREKELKTSSGRRYLKKVINNIIEKWTGSSIG
ncbi:MAG: GIY-YIG nuclease family protein [Patescibacteria group bacterium]|jgi:putative endonuclease